MAKFLTDGPWLTLHLSQRAVTGRVLQFLETGLLAHLDGKLPREERLRFTLHLPAGRLTGELICIGQEGSQSRLQYTALTEQDSAKLLPFMSPEV